MKLFLFLLHLHDGRSHLTTLNCIKLAKELQYAMRRAGQNPTDVEVSCNFWAEKQLAFLFLLQVHDMINKIDDGSGVLNFEDFQMVGDERWCSEVPVCDKRQLD